MISKAQSMFLTRDYFYNPFFDKIQEPFPILGAVYTGYGIKNCSIGLFCGTNSKYVLVLMYKEVATLQYVFNNAVALSRFLNRRHYPRTFELAISRLIKRLNLSAEIVVFARTTTNPVIEGKYQCVPS